MQEFKKNIKHVKGYFKGQGFKVALVIILTALIFGLRVVTPIISAKIIVGITNSLFEQVIIIAIVLWGTEVVWNIIWYFQRKIYQKLYTSVFNSIQQDVGKHILRLNNETLDNNSSGVFIQRLTGDTSNIANAVEDFINHISDVFTSVGTLIAMFIVSIPCAIYSVIVLIIGVIISYFRVKIFNEGDRKLRKVNEKTTGFIGELVRGARDIKMLNSEDSFLKELDKKVTYNNIERYKLKMVKTKWWATQMITLDTLGDFMIIFMIILIMNDKLTITAALIIHNYQNIVSGFSDGVGYLLETYKDFNLSCTRIFNIIESDEFKKEEFGTKHLKSVEGNFEFKNVTFGYNKQKVLKNLSFKVDANTTVGFVGKSGEGKSTIFSLLCKMYDVDKGEILIDGNNINELDKDSIRGNITIISQDPYIFNLSIKDNLKLVKSNATFKEIKEACKMACLDDFIESLPDKYNTIVGEGGVNLSGGQRQRLAIARAFLQKTEIILFDEATSALDNETQLSIQKAIANLQKDYTILIIAHRLSTIKNCDKILLISDGKVEAEGSHEQLLKKSKTYRELYESEIKK